MRAPHGSMSWPREVLRWRWFGLKLLVKSFWRFPLSSVSEQFWLRENRGFALRLSPERIFEIIYRAVSDQANATMIDTPLLRINYCEALKCPSFDFRCLISFEWAGEQGPKNEKIRLNWCTASAPKYLLAHDCLWTPCQDLATTANCEQFWCSEHAVFSRIEITGFVLVRKHVSEKGRVFRARWHNFPTDLWKSACYNKHRHY